jgi:alkylhydroperoxidase family enzyme
MSAARHGRIGWPAPSDLDPAARALYDVIVGGPRAADGAASPITNDAGRLEGPFNAMLCSPRVGGALQGVGAAIRYGSSLDAVAREIAILVVAATEGSPFEWYAHERLARAAGLSEAALLAILDGRPPEDVGAAVGAVWAATAALCASGDWDEEQYGAIQAAVGEAGAVELLVLVGYYRTLALMLRALRVPLPAGAQTPIVAGVRHADRERKDTQ